MSVSTDAYLFYGFHIDDMYYYEPPWWHDDKYDMEGWAKRNDLELPEGVKQSMHCSDSHPEPFYYIEGTYTSAWRGSPKEITSLEVPEGADELLKQFCEAIDLDPKTVKFGWWLASYWG